MFEDIKRNKMKSWIIVLLFLVFIALIIISIFTNLSTIREFIVNKTNLKKKIKMY